MAWKHGVGGRFRVLKKLRKITARDFIQRRGFKFHVRVYHFISSEHGLENIRRRRMKIALIDQLNDPFELLGVASKSASTRQLYRVLKADLSEYMGILCFSASWKNPVQWSHYADHHRGLCLGFDVSAVLHKVRYAKHRIRPKMHLMKAESIKAEAHVREIIGTKFNHWRYEQEHRLFVQLKEKDESTGHYFFDFNNEVRLREVIVGPLSAISRAEIAEAVGDLRSVRIFKSRLAFRTFEVVRQRSEERFWK